MSHGTVPIDVKIYILCVPLLTQLQLFSHHYFTPTHDHGNTVMCHISETFGSSYRVPMKDQKRRIWEGLPVARAAAQPSGKPECPLAMNPDPIRNPNPPPGDWS